MNKEDYVTLLTDPAVQDQLLKIKHTLKLYDISSGEEECLFYNPCEEQFLEIIYDINHTSTPLNYPDTYYCSSFEDLKTIIKYLALYEERYPDEKDIFGFPSE